MTHQGVGDIDKHARKVAKTTTPILQKRAGRNVVISSGQILLCKTVSV